jgi:NTP pyrophosphatase (non-canonical NTP hydrolase)
MPDEKTTLKELKDAIARFEAERDWKQFHSPKNLAMGLAIETGELLEHFQWIDSDASRQVVRDAKQMAAVKEELADVLCYLLNLALEMDVDLSEAFFEKMKRNEAKYPADQYRGKYKL